VEAAEPPEEPPEPQPAEIIIEPDQLRGVWANFAAVMHTPHEFTIDFIRSDPTVPPPGRGIVVARVSFSPMLAAQLLGALEENFSIYAEESIQQEVDTDGTDEANGQEA
jgi:Protein of unknown function (DUF3467)